MAHRVAAQIDPQLDTISCRRRHGDSSLPTVPQLPRQRRTILSDAALLPTPPLASICGADSMMFRQRELSWGSLIAGGGFASSKECMNHDRVRGVLALGAGRERHCRWISDIMASYER
jgi:hypothetical protein